jgi:hypothetical protein
MAYYAGLPEDGDKIQSPKRRVLNKRMIDNVQNCDSYMSNMSHRVLAFHFLIGYRKELYPTKLTTFDSRVKILF